MKNTTITDLENALAVATTESNEAVKAFEKLQRRGASDRFASFESFKKRFTALEDAALAAVKKRWNLESELFAKSRA